MGKIPTIENPFFYILVYSYLLFPILFLFRFRKLKVEKTFTIICIYSLFFFGVLFLDDLIPKKKLYFALYTFIEYIFFVLIIYFNIKNRRFKTYAIFLSIAFIVFQIGYFVITTQQENVVDEKIQNARAQIANLKTQAGQAQYKTDQAKVNETLNVKVQEQEKIIADLKKSKKSIDTFPIGFETILVLVFTFYFFYEQLKESVTPIYDQFFFWIAIGIIVYLCGSFFMYILGNDIPRKQLEEYWFITFIFESIKNLFFVMAGVVFLKRSKSVRKTVLPNLDFY